MAVTDGSSMKALYPDIHLAAFLVLLECKNRMGRIWGSFPELSRCGYNYRGELVGLMAIHLIILATNEANAGPTGRVKIRSDCLGALNKVKNLLPTRILTGGSAHSDILKNMLVNCSDISFGQYYSHMQSAHQHQDNHQTKDSLPRKVQLNCTMDSLAKRALW